MRRKLDRLLRDMIAPPPGLPAADFTAPLGAPALFAPESIAWAVMKNPVALIIGGVAAVLLELAEPRVRTGVWTFTKFRDDPVGRIRRTGYAALVTTYAPAEAARAMIEAINRRHAAVAGATPDGVPFRAGDPELLNWVHATAAYGFVEAYHRYVRPLCLRERDAFYNDGAPAAALYGAAGAPRSEAECAALFETMRPRLEGSPIIFEFLAIMRTAPVLPAPMKPLQSLMLRGAIALLPAWARALLGLDSNYNLPFGGAAFLRELGRIADRIPLASAPPAQSCVRMGLPAHWLYKRRARAASASPG